jgi:hypothetical protein
VDGWADKITSTCRLRCIYHRAALGTHAQFRGTRCECPVTCPVSGGALGYSTAVAAGDCNGDGVTDIAPTTENEEARSPARQSSTFACNLRGRHGWIDT